MMKCTGNTSSFFRGTANKLRIVTICIENRMNVSAFRHIWTRVMFLFSKMHEPQASAI